LYIGRGIVAASNFNKGDFITYYQGITVEDASQLDGVNDTYVFEVIHGRRTIW